MCETGDIFYIAFLRKIRYASGIGHWALAKQVIGHWPNRALAKQGIGQTGHWALGYPHFFENRYIILFEIFDLGVSARAEGLEIEKLRMNK